MLRSSGAAALCALLWLAPALCGQAERPVLRLAPAGQGPVPAAVARPVGQTKDRQEAVQQAMNKMATVAGERQGALYLRDLGKHCGVAAPQLERLTKVLDQAIAQWVEMHPPQVYGSYEVDFRALMKEPSWTKAFTEITDERQRAAWQELEGARQHRLAAATAAFVSAMTACKLRLTPDQVKALEPLCQRIGEQSLEVPVHARPEQMVRELDRTSTHVLSELQTQYPELLQAHGGRRNQALEFDLESERIRLLCRLDDDRAHLLRACGRAQGRRLAAEQVEKQKEAAKAKAKEPKDPAAPPPRPAVVTDLPHEDCLHDPFWAKVRDSLLTDAQKALLAATPAVGKAAVVTARAELVLASLDAVFHLDPGQLKTLTPLAEKVAEQDLDSFRGTTPDVTRSFGMQAGRSESSPEERAAMKALEDILDREQFEVLRDKVGI